MADRVRNIVRLRELLAERFPNARRFVDRRGNNVFSGWPTGIPQLDDLLGGGLAKGAITELVAPHPASGSALIVSALLRRARQNRQWLALVDGVDSFDPAQLDNGSLSRLLWVRCRHAAEAMKAADLIARDNNLPVMLLDLRINPPAQLRKIPSTNWFRLQRILERNAGVLMVLTPFAMVSSAQARISMKGRFRLDDLEETSSALLANQRFELLRAHGAETVRREFMAEAG
jgi:hypothetical protein